MKRYVVILTCLALMLSCWLLVRSTSRADIIPTNDELYHIVAMSSIAEDRGPAIYQGYYPRAQLYTTYLSLFADVETPLNNYQNAKQANQILFVFFVAAFWLTLLSITSWQVALTATILLLISKHSVEYAGTVRFYMAHAVFFWLGTVAMYRFALPIDSFRLRWSGGLWLLFAAVSFAIAAHLQLTTLVGLVGLGFWLVLAAWMRFFDRLTAVHYAAIALLGAVAVGLAFLVLPMQQLLDTYLHAAAWNEGSSTKYYYWMMSNYYVAMVAVLPIAMWIAVTTRDRFGMLSACVFCLGILLHSFAGNKDDRYVYYLLPFIFYLIALLACWTGGKLLQSFSEFCRPLKTPLRRASVPLGIAAVLGCGMVFLLFNTGTVRVIKGVAEGSVKNFEDARWDLAAQHLSDKLSSVDVVMTNSPSHVYFYTQQAPVGMGRSRLTSSRDPREFALDSRTGFMLISEPQSLRSILHCYPQGLIIAEQRQWRNNPNTGFNGEVADIVEAELEPVDVPSEWGLRIYQWQTSVEFNTKPDCSLTAL